MKKLLITETTILMIICIEGNPCYESLPTVQKVTHCPRNDNEWQIAVQRKRCDALASIQNCDPDPKKFVYQCLVNEKADGFVDVCAPKWILTGYCGYFDTALGKIFNKVEIDCNSSSFITPCPARYNSSDSHKYQGCYNITIKREGPKSCEDQGCYNITIKREGPKSCEETFSFEDHLLWIVPWIIAVGSFIGFIRIHIKLRKLESIASPENKSQDEAEPRNQDPTLEQLPNSQDEAEPRDQDPTLEQLPNSQDEAVPRNRDQLLDSILNLISDTGEVVYRSPRGKLVISSDILPVFEISRVQSFYKRKLPEKFEMSHRKKNVFVYLAMGS